MNKSCGKERRKRCIFRRLRKTGRDDADVTWRGMSFQVRAAATVKAPSPSVVDSRQPCTADRQWCGQCRS